jgi:hypothetical protein
VAPQGQQVVAGMVQTLLGQTRVELTPEIEGASFSIREPLRDLVAAELLMGRAPAVPRTLPAGYQLQEVAAVSYPELPDWISQPLYIELCYGIEAEDPGLLLREYRLHLRDGGALSGVQVAGGAVVDLEQVDVAGTTATLLLLESEDEPEDGLHYTVLWERDGMLLELGSDRLLKEELLGVARSVR